MHIVIIGSGAAGLSATQAILEEEQSVEITLISQDTRLYSIFSLPFYIAGEIEDQHLDRFDPETFRAAGVAMRLDTSATSINPETNSVIIKSGENIAYDVLLIATGAIPIIPPIQGLDKEGVGTLSNLQDSQKILALSKGKPKHAVIIGGGFVGIESAIALHSLKIPVTIIEREKHLLPRMLDEDAANLTKQLLQSHHVNVITSATVEAVLGKRRVQSVKVDSDNIACDLVIIAVGVQPNIDIIQDTKIATNKGILVNEFMRTNISNIYAAGDVAEALDRATSTLKVNAIWPNAIVQGRIAGKNMLGNQVRYEGSDAINLINIFDTPILSIGQRESEIGECEVIRIDRGKVFRKLLLRDGKILGYQTIGDLRNAGFILQAHRTKTDVTEVLDALRKDNLISQRFWQSRAKQE